MQRNWLCRSVTTKTVVKISSHLHVCNGCPILLKSSVFQLLTFVSGLSSITAALTTTTVKQQLYIQCYCSVLFSENVTSHLRPGSTSEAVIICGFGHRICIYNILYQCLLSRRLSLLHAFPKPSPSPLLTPLCHFFPPLTSFSSQLFPACQDDFRLVASGLTQCGTIETVITKSLNSYSALPPTYHPQA